MVTAVHKFHFKLVVKDAPNKWRHVERKLCADGDRCFWQDIYVFRRQSLYSVKGTLPTLCWSTAFSWV